MAITKLVSPSTPNPTGTGAGASWDLAMAQLTAVKKILSGEQMLLTQWTNATTMSKLALGIYLQHLGAIYVVASADYTIPTPSSDGTYYVKLTVSGETLTVSVVNSLSGFAWSSQHNGLYNVSNEQILPYQIVRGGAGTTFEKRKILNLANATNAFTTINYLGKVYGSELAVTGALSVGGATTLTGAVTMESTLGVTGAINGASINTGSGDFEVGQDLRITDAVTFLSIAAKRRQITRIGDGTKRTQATWYTDLLPYLPIIGEHILVSGWVLYSNILILNVCRMYRGSTAIFLEGPRAEDLQIITIDSGNAVLGEGVKGSLYI